MDMVARAASIYLVLLVILRISGRRSVAQLTPFDLVLLLIISETTQQALLGEDFSITNAIIVMITLFGVDLLLAWFKRRWPTVAKLVDGGPTLLVDRGKPDFHALRRSRLDIADILAAARTEQGLMRLGEIDFAVLEADGQVSIIPKQKTS